MIRLHSSKWNDGQPLVLLATDDDVLGSHVSTWLDRNGSRVLRVRTSREAIDLLQDAAFLGVDFHGLLVDHDLPDATGIRVAHEFQREFRDVPVAMAVREDSIAASLWARARGVSVLLNPVQPSDLKEWMRRVRPERVGAA